MNSKEQILDEFEKIDSYDLDMESQGSETVRKIFKDFLSKAIDQTREETIREIEGLLPKEEIIVSSIVDYQVEYLRGKNKMLEEVLDILNKLKK